MSQKSHLNQIIEKNIYQTQSFPTQNNHQNSHKQSPDPFYRTGRIKSKPSRIGVQNMIPLQQKILGFAKIIPKQHFQDKELLYSQNIKLKEKIKQLAQQNIRLKTRVNISEKQKDQIYQQVDKITNSTDLKLYSKGGLKHTTVSHHQSSKNSISLQTNNVAKRMFRDAKEQVQKLKLQNQKIKKSIKYTQISQLQTENQNLLQQTSRLQKYIQQIIKQDNYQQYQQAIQELKRKLYHQKQSTKSFPNQLKKKDDQIQQIKLKFINIQKIKNDNDKRLNKEISYLKSEISNLRKLNNEMRLKQRDLKDKSQTNKVKNCQQCTKWQQQKKQLERKINAVQKQLRQSRQKQRNFITNQQHRPSNFITNSRDSRELSQNKSKDILREDSIQNKSFLKEQTKKQNLEKSNSNQSDNFSQSQENLQKEKKDYNQLNNKNNDKQQIKHVQTKQKSIQKIVQQKSENQKYKSGLQSYEDDSFQKQKKQNLKKQNSKKEDYQFKQQYEQDYNQQQFNEQISQKQQVDQTQKPKTIQNKKQNKQQIEKNYNYDDNQFQNKDNNFKKFSDDQSDEEQILFKKQILKNQQLENLSKKQKNSKNKPAKEQKVNKILKQTITYKFLAQRYSYSDFESDLRNSKVVTFSLQDIASMFSNQPFFLNEDQQQFLIIHCYGKTDIQQTDVLTLKTFMKKIKMYIGQIEIIREQQQEQFSKKIHSIIHSKQKSIIKKLQKKEHQPGCVSKKVFKKMLTQLGINQHLLVEYCLGQISVCSLDIQNLNYVDFFKKFAKNQ